MTTPTTTRRRPRPNIDPRIRERRIEVKRRQGRRRLRILVALLSVVLAVAAAAGATRSPLLDVDHVVIAGAQHTTAPAVLGAAALDHHRFMIDAHADRMQRAIARLPWVEHVAVERQWPATVHITLQERVAVASVPANGGGWALADQYGRVLARQAGPAAELPQIQGGAPAGTEGSTLAKPVIDALAVAAALMPELRPRAPVVAITPDGLELRLVPSGVARLGSVDQVVAKLDAVLTVLDHANTAGLVVLDVRVPGAPVLTRR